ncbi:hypothetical protein [Teichococcus oryzae]|uniref:Uncharacterized protein n=1 Tax=Teichococcus oryzae TaxID=1608942 RepID=A0A5B2TAQ0_9PROT|nr:hypothetical protein [Pseudoroseomonas oryzae]KAA2211592.1 hypothetical protein F0Q34_19215 [Pseudoroseomonas oryzae]
MVDQQPDSSSLAAEVEQACARMGMEPEEPLRLLLTSSARAQDRLREEMDRIGQEAALRAAEAALREVREGMRRAARELSLTRKVLYGAVPMLALLVGFVAGWRMPVQTTFGPMSRETLAVFRSNDLDAAYRACVDQPPQRGRRWCQLPLWREVGTPGQS